MKSLQTFLKYILQSFTKYFLNRSKLHESSRYGISSSLKLPRLLPKDVGPIVMLLDKLGCDRSLFDVIEIMHYNIAIFTVFKLSKWCCSPFYIKQKLNVQ